jgi:hypothetical protein
MRGAANVFLFAFAGVALLALSLSHVRTLPRVNASAEIEVSLPLFVQVGMAAGDRYLAANGAAIRTLVTSTARMQPDDYRILAQWQQQVAWLNPAHEDNYYTATAILPWNGQVEATQNILSQAMQARPKDYQPAFHYAFHRLYFYHDPVGAADWLRRSAELIDDPNNQLVMQNLAAMWMDKSKDLDNAIAVVSAIASQAKRHDFRRYLELRIERLQHLKYLRVAAAEFAQRNHRPVRDLRELVAAGLIKTVPADPFGFGYDVDINGLVILRTTPRI